tara:strand:+ start:810 stop:1124 length:315 start_codon:yes stop_codon:yes gene_type:complete
MKVRAVTGARTITANSTTTFSTSTAALAANDYRKSFIVTNMAVDRLYVNLSGTAPTATACHFVLPGCSSVADGTGGTVSVDGYVGAVTVAGTGAGGSYSVVEFG